MEHHAHGTFDIKLQPVPSAVTPGISHFSFDKVLHGDLEGTSSGEMISAGDPKAGTAGYVAMEMVKGKVGGKTGSFALQQFATMDKSGQTMQIVVVPGSGSGELEGITGTLTITIANGQHSYDFAYTLPADK